MTNLNNKNSNNNINKNNNNNNNYNNNENDINPMVLKILKFWVDIGQGSLEPWLAITNRWHLDKNIGYW